MLWWTGETLRRESIRKSGEKALIMKYLHRGTSASGKWVLSHCKNSSRGYLESWGRDSSRGQMRWHPSVRVWNSVTFEEHIQLGSSDDIGHCWPDSALSALRRAGTSMPSLPYAHWPLHILSPHLHALSCSSPRLCCYSWNALASSSLLPGATSVSSRSSPSQPLSQVRGSIWPWRLFVKWLPGVVSALSVSDRLPEERKHLRIL